MRIVLVVTNSRRKNLVFSADTLKAYTLNEAIELAKRRALESVHSVKTGRGAYIRSDPNSSSTDNLDHLSVSAAEIFASSENSKLLTSLPGLKEHVRHFSQYLRSLKEEIIFIDGIPRTTKEGVQRKLRPHRKLIREAAEHFSVDPSVLAAIIIDEISRMAPFELISDALLPDVINYNTSVGFAQVKLDTARGLIQLGHYNPNPNDENLSRERVATVSREYLYQYVVQPKHSIYFAAARMREIIDQWSQKIDLSHRPEILGTLYHQKPRTPNLTPGPDERGLQIQKEFLPLAESILTE